ncbi:MAG TPA: YkgJ family cysteine cluster protein [Panacibacter sp.]|nr:YkgJ family cysteine cluster protein [Panacibacter sp.]
MITNLHTIAEVAEINTAENLRFKEFLKAYDSDKIDALVFTLNELITPQIDCTSCGNCCRSLMINVDADDAARLSGHMKISSESFYKKYIEQSSQGTLAVMNAIPCHFLSDSKCTVYEARPKECREFPGLHQPGFTGRLFATFMHYGRCPIIFNVIEALKTELMPAG